MLWSPLKLWSSKAWQCLSYFSFFLSFFPCHSISLPSIRFHFLAFPFIPFHVLPFTLVSLVGHAPPRHQHCTSYSRKEKRIRFILKFGSVFVSAVRFCDVSAGVSAGVSARAPERWAKSIFFDELSRTFPKFLKKKFAIATTTDVTFETYFISFDFPLQARPNVAKPLKVMKQQILTMTFSFFFLFFLFFP